MMKQGIIQSIKHAKSFSLACSLALGVSLLAHAVTFTKVNPVAGATEDKTFFWAFTGSDGNWSTLDNWVSSSGGNPTAVPEGVGTNIYQPILFDGENLPEGAVKDISMSGPYSGGTYDLEGWDLQIGVFNGVNVTIKNIKYWQGGSCYAMVDANSKLIVSGMGGNNWQHTIDYYVAAQNGVTYSCALAANADNSGSKFVTQFNYYLTGDGSVSYQAISKKSTHTIKRADILLSVGDGSGAKCVRSKPLVTWTSTANATFAADATIKIANGEDQTVTSIQDSLSLESSSEVGTCQLVKTQTGIYLHYVDYLTPRDFTYNCHGTLTQGASSAATFAGGSPSGWVTSFSQSFASTGPFLFGPTVSATYSPMVKDGNRPYQSLASRDKYTILLYADIEEAAKGSVLLSYGNMNNDKMHALLKTSDGKVKLSCYPGSATEAGSGITTETANYKGYHLYAITFDTSSGQKLYVDGVLAGENTSATTAPYASGGLQIGSGYGSNPSGYTHGDGMAVHGVYGYNCVLSADEILALAQQVYPAKESYAFGGDFNYSGGNVEVHFHDCTATATNGKFGASDGTIVIPGGNTITTTHFRFLNTEDGDDSVTLKLYGKVVVNSDSDNPWTYIVTKGVLFGHYKGTGTYNVYGELDSQNTYVSLGYNSVKAQTLNIDGGTVKARGLSRDSRTSGATVTLTNNGTLEVSDCLTATTGSYTQGAITQNYGYGTIKFTGSAKTITAPQAASFTDAGNGTTIDVNGNNVTFSGNLSGEGKVIFKDTLGTGSVTLSGAVSAAVEIPAGMTVNVASGGSITGNISGAGKVVFAAWSGYPNLADAWTGTVKLPALTTPTTSGFCLNRFGTANSTIEITSFTGWLKDTGNYAMNLQSALKLDGPFLVDGMSVWDYTFAKISGSGNFTLQSATEPYSLTITEVAGDYTGIISDATSKPLNITKLSFPEGKTFAVGEKLLATGGTGTINVGSVTVDGVAQSNISYSRDTNGASGEGFYVHSIATAEGTGSEAVTTVDADVTSVTVALGDGYTGKLVIPQTVTQVTTTGSSIDAANLGLKVTYTPVGESETSAIYYNIATLDGSGNVSLNPSATVDSVKVQPETADAAPMSVATDKTGFSVKTIPGLWYSVWSSATVGEGGALGGTIDKPDEPVQATSATTTVDNGAATSTGVRYYKIVVGATKASLK